MGKDRPKLLREAQTQCEALGVVELSVTLVCSKTRKTINEHQSSVTLISTTSTGKWVRDI